jgi:D-alanyl-D-alanine carboxypeptidase
MAVGSRLGLLLLAAMLACSCAQPQEEETPVPTQLMPSATPTATPTSPPPTPTPTPAPTAYAVTVQPVTATQLPYTYAEGCPVPAGDLRLLTMTHHGFDGVARTGEMVVHADSADAVGRIFGRLYEAGFPIERMRLVDAYGGSTEASLADNNTSGFHCRPVTGGTRWSEHAYGWAIDVNPVQNPYVRGDVVLPESGRAFLDRGVDVPGLIVEGDLVVAAFAAEGWTWGGTWTTLCDYQHFSLTGR